MNRNELFHITSRKLLGPIITFLDDPEVSEIMINGVSTIYIEKRGQLQLTEARFEDEEALLAAARNIAQYNGKHLDEFTASFDARLPDGSRVCVSLSRCSHNGLTMTIRKFARQHITLSGLVESGALSAEAREYLETIVGLHRNVLVYGGTGSGKTSLLNALSESISPHARVIVIEDTHELQLQLPHVLYREAVLPDAHGRGEVTIRDLLRTSLRERPDRLVIGEVRSHEAFDLIQALLTGHCGSLSTIHAESPLDALNRLEVLASMAGVPLPPMTLRMMIASVIHVLVKVSRLEDGRRAITNISEVERLSTDKDYQVRPLFERLSGASDSLQWMKEQSLFTALAQQLGSQIALTYCTEIFS